MQVELLALPEGFQFSGLALERELAWDGRMSGRLFDSSISCSARRYACSPVAEGELERDVDLLALRHEVAVLRRGSPRPRLRWSDRAFFSALAGLLSPERRAGLNVSPATLVRWQRDLARKRWCHPHRAQGRPATQAARAI